MYVCISIDGYSYVMYPCNGTVTLQDDILVGTLTVQENLMFSATLRLPALYNWEAQKKKVSDIIYELGLEKVANNKVCA